MVEADQIERIGFGAFLWLCLKEAWKTSWEKSDTATAIAGGIIGALIHYFPQWQQAVTSILWQIPIASLASIVLVRFALSPFLIFRKRDKEARIAEENLKQAEKALQATPPAVRPHGYGKSADQNASGLTITNGGYLAFDVHIPPVLLEPSGYTLTFPEILTQLGERDHRRFIAADLDHETLPDVAGEVCTR